LQACCRNIDECKFYFGEEKIMKKFLVLLLVVCAAGIASAASAAVTWTGGTGNWNTVGAWSSMYPPVSTDTVWIANPGSNVTIGAADGAVHVKAIDVGEEAGAQYNMILNVTGGSLTVDGTGFWDLTLGYGGGGTGTMNISGGLVHSAEHMMVGGFGRGTLNMTGGELDVDGAFVVAQATGYGGTGTMNLSGGLIKCGVLGKGDGTSANSHINLSGTAQLAMWTDNNAAGTFASLIASGILVGSGGTIGYSTTMNPGYTTAYITPEPVSIVLLGLGSLFVARRRK
jgi:hypothetical protein